MTDLGSDIKVFYNNPDIIANRNPIVKIGIPAYNRPEGLKKIINYLITQPYKDIEIYVSEDGDCNYTLPHDVRITYTHQPVRLGPIENFYFVYNQGGPSDYFMWMSDDDTFSENYIYECVKFLENNQDYSLCAGVTYMDNYMKDAVLNIKSFSGIIRMFLFFAKVYKCGVFYGVFRNNRNYTPVKRFEPWVAFDWWHVAQLALDGNIRVIENAFMVKSSTGISSKPHGEKRTLWKLCRRLPLSVPLFLFLNIKFLLKK